MGQRISYFKNNFGKGLKDLLFENYSKFRAWYLDFDKCSMEEFNESFGNEIIKDYFKQERNLSVEFGTLDQKFVDELTSEFIGTYYDLTYQHNEILDFFGPMFNKWRYVESTKLVLKTNDSDFIDLWTYITKGRSLKDGLYFDSFTNEYKIGYLDRQEYLLLRSKIEYHFGDEESIRNKYWTNKEKRQIEKQVNDNSIALTGHNPKTSGLEFVLCALNELTDKNKELITGIE
jgi:uncharacterized protein Usg